MRLRIFKILIGLCFIYGTHGASADVKITIDQTSSKPKSYDSEFSFCSDRLSEMTKGDRDLEGLIISRFGSKRSFLRKCANDAMRESQQKLKFPVKEVYCELEAYQRTIESMYEDLEGHSINWKMFRALTVIHSASSNCMNEDIPNS